MAGPSSGCPAHVSTLLVIERHDAVKDVLRDWLSAHLPNWRCYHAGSVEEAQTVFAVQLPELIVIGSGLSFKDDLNMLQQARRSVPRARAIVLTDYDPGPYRDEFIRQGAIGCVGKYELNKLIPLIQRATESPVRDETSQGERNV
jgi:DNA-binding NarL/FixJ family response regulator